MDSDFFFAHNSLDGLRQYSGLSDCWRIMSWSVFMVHICEDLTQIYSCFLSFETFHAFILQLDTLQECSITPLQNLSIPPVLFMTLLSDLWRLLSMVSSITNWKYFNFQSNHFSLFFQSLFFLLMYHSSMKNCCQYFSHRYQN